MNLDFNQALYSAADILQVPLLRDGTQATTPRPVKLGPVELAFLMKTLVDFISPEDVGVLVQFRGQLWGYLHTVHADRGNTTLTLFQGAPKVELNWYKTGSKEKTLARIGKSAIGTLQLNQSLGIWERIDGAVDAVDEHP